MCLEKTFNFHSSFLGNGQFLTSCASFRESPRLSTTEKDALKWLMRNAIASFFSCNQNQLVLLDIEKPQQCGLIHRKLENCFHNRKSKKLLQGCNAISEEHNVLKITQKVSFYNVASEASTIIFNIKIKSLTRYLLRQISHATSCATHF